MGHSVLMRKKRLVEKRLDEKTCWDTEKEATLSCRIKLQAICIMDDGMH